MYVEYGTSQAKISWNQAAKWHSEIVLENLFSQQAAQPLSSENYQITQEHLGAGGAKYKFQKNLEAILLVKRRYSKKGVKPLCRSKKFSRTMLGGVFFRRI